MRSLTRVRNEPVIGTSERPSDSDVLGSLGVVGSSLDAEPPLLLLEPPTTMRITIRATTPTTANTIPMQPATPQPPSIFAAPPPPPAGAGGGTGGGGGGGAPPKPGGPP